MEFQFNLLPFFSALCSLFDAALKHYPQEKRKISREIIGGKIAEEFSWNLLCEGIEERGFVGVLGHMNDQC